MRKTCFTISLLLFTSLASFSQLRLGVYGSNYCIGWNQCNDYYSLGLRVVYKTFVLGVGPTFYKPVNSGTFGYRSKDIEWDQYPQEHYGSGKHYRFFDFSLGYALGKHFIVGFRTPFIAEWEYRNCYTTRPIHTRQGYYYKMRRTGKRSLDWGVDLDYVGKIGKSGLEITCGISFSGRYGTGISLGILGTVKT